jgi:hypothetical protein
MKKTDSAIWILVWLFRRSLLRCLVRVGGAGLPSLT